MSTVIWESLPKTSRAILELTKGMEAVSEKDFNAVLHCYYNFTGQNKARANVREFEAIARVKRWDAVLVEQTPKQRYEGGWRELWTVMVDQQRYEATVADYGNGVYLVLDMSYKTH